MKTKAEASQAPELYDPPLGEGEPLIMPPLLPGILVPGGATSTFEKFVRFRKLGKDGAGWPTVISEALAKQYLSSSECRELLPPLKGILRCPILVERDGSGAAGH